jgi:hypothetical protein
MEWTKEKLVALLDSNDKAVWKAVHRIYQNQTDAEKMVGETSEYNGIGFSGADGGLLSSFAQFYEKHGHLSQKQTAIARKKMKKYTRQLLDYIKENRS